MDYRYRKDYADQAMKLRLLGATYREVADFFNEDEGTIRRWMRKHEGFRVAMTEGGDMADALVAQAMFRRAIGYTHPEDKIFVYQGEVTTVATMKHYPPDTQAAQFWLQTRQREKWGAKATSATPDIDKLQIFTHPEAPTQEPEADADSLLH